QRCYFSRCGTYCLCCIDQNIVFGAPLICHSSTVPGLSLTNLAQASLLRNETLGANEKGLRHVYLPSNRGTTSPRCSREAALLPPQAHELFASKAEVPGLWQSRLFFLVS